MASFSKISERAELARKYLARSKRASGETYWARTDDAPDWMDDFCREAHGTDMLPDDYRYSFIVDALDAIIEHSSEDEAREAISNGVEVYTARLTAWLASHVERVAYVDDACEELGRPDDLVTALQYGMLREQEQVFASTVSALADLDTGDDEEDSDDD